MPSLRRPSGRAKPTASNRNHHLWQHGRNWWVYCAVTPTPCTKDKLRRSLCTEDVQVARRRRDELFRQLQAEGLLGRIRSAVATTGRRVTPEVKSDLTWQQRADAALAIAMALNPPKPKKLPGSVVGTGRGKLQLCC